MGECLPTRCRRYYRIQREPFTLGDAVAEGAAADAERVAADDAVPAVIDLVAVLIQGANLRSLAKKWECTIGFAPLQMSGFLASCFGVLPGKKSPTTAGAVAPKPAFLSAFTNS
jgi:hypothetical protein